MRHAKIVTAALLMMACGSQAFANVVTDWNAVALDTIRAARTSPPMASRVLAIMHVSIYDAVNGISRRHETYFVRSAVPAGALPEAAAGAAAYRVLVTFFPDRAADYDALLATTLSAMEDGPQRASGVAWGEFVADQILEWRATDGADAVMSPPVGGNPGDWVPTPPGFAPYLLPQWGMVVPFGMASSDQFRPNGPPRLDSATWAENYREVQALGAAVGSSRTAEQSAIAQFWADGAGTETPPGHWNHIAQAVVAMTGTTLDASARLFALLNIAMADAAICAWDAKYTLQLLATRDRDPPRGYRWPSRHRAGPELVVIHRDASVPGLCLGAQRLQCRRRKGAHALLRPRRHPFHQRIGRHARRVPDLPKLQRGRCRGGQEPCLRRYPFLVREPGWPDRRRSNRQVDVRELSAEQRGQRESIAPLSPRYDSSELMRVSAIIAAGGRGTRLGSDRPKQFLEIGGRSILDLSVSAVASSSVVGEIVVAVPADHLEGVRSQLRPPGKPVAFVAGGRRRQDSVARALARVSTESDIVVVHDAARPFVSVALIDRTIAAGAEHGAAIAALPVRDTVKQATSGRHSGSRPIAATLPREDIFLAQTPQAFRREVLERAFDIAREQGIEATDEATLAERAGYPVHLVEGEAGNVKIDDRRGPGLGAPATRGGAGAAAPSDRHGL